MIPPVFLRDPASGDLVAFPSAEDAARHLAPWQEVSAIAAYDARGDRVTFAIERRRGRLLGVDRELVVVAGVEADAAGAEELRRALIAALATRGQDRRLLEQLALGELVARGGSSLRRGG